MSDIGTQALWLLVALIVAVSIALAVGSILVADRTLPKTVGAGHNAVVSPFLTVIGLVFGALLGFTVVVAWEQFSSAKADVSNEASTVTTMYRQTVGMPTPEQTRMRQLMRTYTMAVAGPEWNKQDIGGTDTARAAITDMYRTLSSQPAEVASTPINREFLSQLTILTSDRSKRVLDAQPRIPWLLWCGLLFGAVVLITITGFLRMNSRVGHIMLSSSIAILLGLLLFIVYWLDHPYGSQAGITSAPFEHSLEVFNAVDSGT